MPIKAERKKVHKYSLLHICTIICEWFYLSTQLIQCICVYVWCVILWWSWFVPLPSNAFLLFVAYRVYLPQNAFDVPWCVHQFFYVLYKYVLCCWFFSVFDDVVVVNSNGKITLAWRAKNCIVFKWILCFFYFFRRRHLLCPTMPFFKQPFFFGLWFLLGFAFKFE